MAGSDDRLPIYRVRAPLSDGTFFEGTFDHKPDEVEIVQAARLQRAPADAPAAEAARAGGTGRAIAKFARALVAARDPRVGAKIWMELDMSDNPVRALTPDEADAAVRAGQNVIWMHNVFSGGQ